MQYIKNKGRYAIAFIIQKNNRDVKIELDVRRVYRDTGNIATTGITAVDEETLTELKKQKRFNQMLEKEELTILNEKDVRTPEENKIKELEEKNKELEKKLKEAEKKNTAKEDLEKKTLADENASLKAKLEALTAKKDESEGF